MPVSNRIKNQHLLWRAAFGPMAENAANLGEMRPNQLWDLLMKTSDKSPEKLDVANMSAYNDVLKDVHDLKQFQSLSKEQKKELRQQSREDLQKLNLRWIDEMINSESQLREKMSLFWHGHFACRDNNILYNQQLLDIIRRNALGKFGDLLMQVSKSAAMLQFLNNQQNKKMHPNENFAREVMELFTMGRGNYSEEDVKEAARAFTGWGYNFQGEFVFRNNVHDGEGKKFLGKSGNFDGDDVIRIILEQKQTAKYIVKKIYRYFVNEDVDLEKVNWLAERFYKNDYHILLLLQDIFTSQWFYEEKNIGTKIKSPIDLLVGIRRLLPLELRNDDAQLLFQKALGQVLFYPPNVAGWPGGKSWIDSSTLMLRLRVPQIITANEVINIRPKNDDDVMMGQMPLENVLSKQNKEFTAKGGAAIVQWDVVDKIFENIPREKLLHAISETVLQSKSKVSDETLSRFLNSESRENYIKSVIINLMSTPEYQLC